ncbi:MAG: phosphoglycolate phosphatase [Gammaproteobacteria bacterium]
MLKKPKMILIDLDGTLVDSVPDLAFCVDKTMEALGMPPRGEARVRLWVGNGIVRLVQRALTGEMDGEADPALYERALPIFKALYAERTCVDSYLYPGVQEGLALLKGVGYALGCVTNKPAQFTEPLLEKLGISNNFTIIISGDTLPQQKPHPEPLLHAARFFGVLPEQALMVGDSVSDVKAARAAGFAIVCMSYGYNHGQDIRAAHPDAVIDSLVELSSLLDKTKAVA